jgi:hypothetical protein
MSDSAPPPPHTDQSGLAQPRTLVYCPVIHSVADLGALGKTVRTATHAALGAEAWRRRVHTVEQMWTEVERMIAAMHLEPARTRVYQDGLPICPHELDIVKEMTDKGSRNHRILLRLHAAGATLMGTESAPLLLEEYNLAKRLLTMASDQDEDVDQNQDQGRSALQMQACALLKARDRFIAERINSTLAPGEVGILFLGMLHNITPWLAPDIQVDYPLGTPIGAAVVDAPTSDETAEKAAVDPGSPRDISRE